MKVRSTDRYRSPDARRRRLLVASGTLLAAPALTLAQPTSAKIPRIGFLGAATPEAWAPRLDAFRAGLRDLGYVEGRSIVIEYRFAGGKYERLPELAAELVRLKVDVIVTHAAPGALAAKQATAATPIPVVITNVGDAVGWGIVDNLARPGGNITGDTFFVTELAAKRLEVLKDALPRVRRVAVLANPDNPRMGQSFDAMEAVARDLNLVMLKVLARQPADLDGAFASMAKERADAVTVLEDAAVFIPQGRRIAALAITQRLPAISSTEFADAGGLLGYGVDFLALYRRAPVFVDRILKGAKPGDIPFERPTKFEYVINLKTASALGVSISQGTRLRADRVIEA